MLLMHVQTTAYIASKGAYTCTVPACQHEGLSSCTLGKTSLQSAALASEHKRWHPLNLCHSLLKLVLIDILWLLVSSSLAPACFAPLLQMFCVFAERQDWGLGYCMYAVSVTVRDCHLPGWSGCASSQADVVAELVPVGQLASSSDSLRQHHGAFDYYNASAQG